MTAELYAVAPGDFVARRTELAARARQDGDGQLAKEVTGLRRPTVAAWLVNRLVLEGTSDATERLAELGGRLRSAQAGLDGPAIRELTRERQRLVAELVRSARDLVSQDGQSLSAAVERELEETFGAAVADEQAELAVTSGRLTRALAYAGMGGVDVTAATATPLGSRRPARAAAPARRAPGPGPDTGAGRDAAQQAVATARALVDAAEADVDAGAQTRDAAERAEVDAADRLDDLQRAVVQARRDLGAAGKAAEAAKREHLRRQQAARSARAQLRSAEQALDRLT